MASRVSISKLNATTLDILNVIRQNASALYQNRVPEVTDPKELPKIGDILYGYPALANEFLSALINKIALTRIKTSVFNNPFADLKKGYLENGEVVEEIFVNLAKAREFSAEKSNEREFKRTIPDVRAAFHAMNYKAQYPVTIEIEKLRMAFRSNDGVTDMITNIVDSVYRADEYDEYLLFKYLMIKAIAKGKMYPIGFDGSNINNAAKKFRGASNNLTFVNTKYNSAGVHTITPKADQHIFMDTYFNADFDVDVLARAFNMDKADFMGRLRLIDDWTTFDNDRFSEIIENSGAFEPITDAELALMADVKAVLVDEEWFQFYDNLTIFTENQVASGIYWNYYLNIWRTVSSSPFSNAIVFIDTQNSANVNLPSTYSGKVTDKSVSEMGTIFTVEVTDPSGYNGGNFTFVQTDDATEKGIAVHKYGAYIIPPTSYGESVEVVINVDGNYYGDASHLLTNATEIGTTFSLTSIDSIEPITVASATGSLYNVAVTDMQTGVTVSDNGISGTLKYLSGSNAITDVWGAGNFLCLKFTTDDWSDYTSVKVGLDPSAGSGLVEIKDDDTHDGVFKISNKKQKFVVIATNGVTTIEKRYSLTGLTLQRS